MKNCFHGDYFKSYLSAKPGILFFSLFSLELVTCIRDFRHTIASEITMIGHGV